jgi:diguanylate cyclase (GGDEF)-like protein
LILPNTTPQNSFVICDHLREQFSKIRFTGPKYDFSVSFSAGIASYPLLNDTGSLISAADKALYQAKQRGSNQVVCFE